MEWVHWLLLGATSVLQAASSRDCRHPHLSDLSNRLMNDGSPRCSKAGHVHRGAANTGGWFRSSHPGYRHAIEQVSRRWRGGRRGDSGRTRRKFDVHTGGSSRASATCPRRGPSPAARSCFATLIGHEVAAREPVRVSQPGARGYRTVNNL